MPAVPPGAAHQHAPVADTVGADATMLLRQVPPTLEVDPEGATQLIPPVPVAEDAEATRHIPVVDAESTTRPRAAGRPSWRPGAASDTAVDLEATRQMPTISGNSAGDSAGDFAQLFQSAADEPPRRTARRRAAPRRPGWIPLVGVVCCAAVGLAAGAALGGGDADGDRSGDTGVTTRVQPAEPASPDSSPDSGADTAEAQARDLSELLADSNDNREAVISSVVNIRSCVALGRAAEDLRSAAEQRDDLVTRLDDLPIDQLPGHLSLAAALTGAWEASAEADEHYADWADQARTDRKVCKHGEARHTGSAVEGDRASGEATRAKERAARLWNPVAREYGLPERHPSQL